MPVDHRASCLPSPLVRRGSALSNLGMLPGPTSGMETQPVSPTKKTLNLALLFWTGAPLVLFCTGAHFLHGYQMNRHARNERAQALRAEEEGRYDRAATCWYHYLAFAPEDT